MSRKRNKVMKNSSGCHDINKVIMAEMPINGVNMGFFLFH